ncbi:MAG: E3 ubiquitin ligase family protein [Spirochaetes bacterium]|nr:E3 ubiquitin ligase family protein [Spirochaetota bacterium]
MIFIPIGLFALGIVLFLVSRSQSKKAYDMQSVETSSSADLATAAADVAREIGAGSFHQQAELKGKAECDTPLSSEHAELPCIWYRSTITREYEERYTERDSEGRSQTRTRRGSEIVSTNERRTNFMLRDASGTISIDPEGASMDGEKLLSRFEQGKSGASVTIGGMSFNFGGLSGGRNTLGYRLEEWGIPVGKTLYILGEATDKDGQLHLAKPETKGQRYLISVKSEEQLVKAAKTGTLVLRIIAAVLAAGAVVSLFFVL